MSRYIVSILAALLFASSTAAHADEAGAFPATVEGQLERISATLPCPFDDDGWKVSSRRRPPDRLPCPWTAQTEAATRALFREAVANRAALPSTVLRADPARHAGRAYLFSGRVRAVALDTLGRTRFWLTASDGQEIEALAHFQPLYLRVGATIDVVGYLAAPARWERDALPLLAAADVLAAGEVARLVDEWRHARPSIARCHWFRLAPCSNGHQHGE